MAQPGLRIRGRWPPSSDRRPGRVQRSGDRHPGHRVAGGPAARPTPTPSEPETGRRNGRLVRFPSVTVRLIAGLVVTVVALAVAGYRVQWLARLVLAGAPIPPERRPHVIGAIKAQITDVFAQRKLFKVKVAGHRPRLHVLGLHRPVPHDHRGVRRAVQARLRDPGHRPEPRARLHRGPVRGRRAARARSIFTVIRLQELPAAARPQVPLLRLAHRPGLHRARHDLPGHRDAAALPRRADPSG